MFWKKKVTHIIRKILKIEIVVDIIIIIKSSYYYKVNRHHCHHHFGIEIILDD